MTPRLLAQLAFVATCDADAIEDRYAWPPRPPLSGAELDDVANLRAVADACFERAEAAGCSVQSHLSILNVNRPPFVVTLKTSSQFCPF